MDVFVVQHLHHIDEDDEDVKFIGVYSTEERATVAVERLSRKRGFSETASGFQIDRYTMDEDNWAEGFVREETGKDPELL